MKLIACQGGVPLAPIFEQRRAIRTAKRRGAAPMCEPTDVRVPYTGCETIADMARDEMALIESERADKATPKPAPAKKTPTEARSEQFARSVSRLMSLIDVRGPSECWPWIGGAGPTNSKYPATVYPRAYGFDPLHSPKPRSTYPYRLMYLLRRGQIPDGMTVDHICFNPLCCNPDHLQLLTRAENSARKKPKPSQQSGPGSDTATGQ